jgi:acyl-CoA reductase-like NAD-dependent aldehyde dehydrogenase
MGSVIADRFHPAEELSDHVLSRFYIDGKWQPPASDSLFALVSPVTERVQAKVPSGSIVDMEKALDAAHAAFTAGPWPKLTHAERAVYLRRIAAAMRERLPLFKRLWTAQVAAPAWMAEAFLPLTARHFDFYADLAATFPFEEARKSTFGHAKVVREPVGVCALIIPWNSPLFLLTQKLAPALLAGCTVVVKPCPDTPFDALVVAECVQAAGVPPGVVNIIPAGRETGDWLVRQKRIDKVSFTGSTAVGKHIGAVCAERIARVSLELGGKSASIICEDADLAEWVEKAVPFTMPMAGQVCFSQTRVLVPKRRHQAFIDAYVAALSARTLGDPWEMSTFLGPVASAAQRTRVLGYMDVAKKEGARAVLGGGAAHAFDRGYFIEPTIFDGVTNGMRIAQEEVFGPVVCVIEYEDDDDAVRIANESDYGLSGTVFSGDLERAERIARRIRTGNISINGLQLDLGAPFGGYKQSGLGREGGPEGLAPYLETKTIYLP